MNPNKTEQYKYRFYHLNSYKLSAIEKAGTFSLNNCIITFKILASNLTNMEKSHFCVYIMTNDDHSRLYTGRTSDLKRRVGQHKSGNGGVFTRRYNLARLVYFEVVNDGAEARLRERQIKRGGKKLRVRLIEGMNPAWIDLYGRLPINNDTMDTADTKDRED